MHERHVYAEAWLAFLELEKLRRAVWKQTFERRPCCAQCLSTGETFDRGSG